MQHAFFPHSVNKIIVLVVVVIGNSIIGSLRNHDDYGNRNVTNLHI